VSRASDGRSRREPDHGRWRPGDGHWICRRGDPGRAGAQVLRAGSGRGRGYGRAAGRGVRREHLRWWAAPGCTRRRSPHARSAREAAGPGRPPLSVGVFGRQPLPIVLETAHAAGLDVIQLHADPTAEQIEALRAHWAGPVWGVLRIGGAVLPVHAGALFAAADAVVLDARVPGSSVAPA
jgi:hypothetical protein